MTDKQLDVWSLFTFNKSSQFSKYLLLSVFFKAVLNVAQGKAENKGCSGNHWHAHIHGDLSLASTNGLCTIWAFSDNYGLSASATEPEMTEVVKFSTRVIEHSQLC